MLLWKLTEQDILSLLNQIKNEAISFTWSYTTLCRKNHKGFGKWFQEVNNLGIVVFFKVGNWVLTKRMLYVMDCNTFLNYFCYLRESSLVFLPSTLRTSSCTGCTVLASVPTSSRGHQRLVPTCKWNRMEVLALQVVRYIALTERYRFLLQFVCVSN